MGVVCLIDDILVHGETQAQHDERLVKVLNLLQESGLTLNSEKCKFSQTKVQFLGHVIDGGESTQTLTKSKPSHKLKHLKRPRIFIDS